MSTYVTHYVLLYTEPHHTNRQMQSLYGLASDLARARQVFLYVNMQAQCCAQVHRGVENVNNESYYGFFE